MSSKILYQFAIVCTLSLLSTHICAQEKKDLNRAPIVFSHITTQDGLANDFVSAIIQDRHGFIWIGTNNGLNRYDGKTFKLYKHNSKDRNSLSGNHITALFEDADGNIWVGTRNSGLNKYNPVTQKVTRYTHKEEDSNSINSGYVAQVYQDSEKRIWVCLYQGGLELFDEKSKKFIHHTWSADNPYSIAGNKVKAIHEIKKGKYLVGTFEAGDGIRDIPSDGHINVYDINTSQFSPLKVHGVAIKPTYRQQLRIVERLIHTIYPDGMGNIWFGSYCGVIKYQPKEDKFYCYQNDDMDDNSLSHNTVRAICELDGQLYFGTQGGGLSVLNNESGQFSKYVNNPFNASSLSNDFIRVIYKDKEDRLWIGTDGGGVNVVQPSNKNFKLYANRHLKVDPSDRLEDATIRALDVDDKGVAYIGSYSGLTVLNTKTNDVKYIGKKQVYAITPAAEGKYWIGVGDRPMLFDKKGLTTIDYSKKIKGYSRPKENIPILKIVKLRDELLLGYRSNPFVVVNLTNSKVTNYKGWRAELMVADNSGGAWCSNIIDGLQKGIVYIDKEWNVKKFQHIDSDTTSISSNNINCLYIDHQQKLWVATEEGLDIYDEKRDGFIHKKIKGVADGIVKAMVADKVGNMWLLTQSELIKLDKQNHNTASYIVNKDLPIGKTESIMIYSDYDSAIYFTANEGLVKFHPSKVLATKNAGRILITDFKLFNEPIKADTAVEQKLNYFFEYTEHTFSISFTFISYNSKEPIEYSYKLDGLYDEWQNVGTNREVNFTNLPPGDYTFQVRGRNSEGDWVFESAKLIIKIDIPWWQSKMFYLVCFVLIGLVLWRYNKYRTTKFLVQKQELEMLVEKRTLQYKEQKEQAEKSERLRQDFMANISHEIRTPMNAIGGFANLLLEKGPTKEQEHFLNIIRQSSSNLTHTINEILDFSKIEAGKLELEEIRFSIAKVVETVINTCSFKAERKGLNVCVHIDKNLSGDFIGDPYKLNQVLLNLYSNAIKFTDKGTVQLIVKELKSDEARTLVGFSIEDTGVGITNEKLDSLFESYIQVNSSDTRKYGGTGLGLTISKSLVTLMGGNIFVESEVGKGTTFSFSISLSKAVTKKKVVKKVQSAELNGLRILLADDDEYNRLVLIESLTLKASIHIDSAVNGEEALALIKENKYDIVLMDIQMPVINGIEATKIIRTKFDERKSQVPIIALTATTKNKDIQNCQEAGMNAYITKPFDMQQLINTVAILSGRLNIASSDNVWKINKVVANTKNNTSISDITYLQTLCEFDEVRIGQYIKLYIESIPSFMDQVAETKDLKDLDKLQLLIHAFKPKWSMMGMTSTIEVAVSLDELDSWQDVLPYLDKLLENTQESINELSLKL